jgi:hypothetical protein
MKITLEHGSTYKALVNASIGSELGLKLLHMKLTAAGFTNIRVASVKSGVEVVGKYDGPTMSVDLEQQVQAVTKVA